MFDFRFNLFPMDRLRSAGILLAASTLLGACSPGDPAERAEGYLSAAQEALKEARYTEAVIELKNAIQTKPDYAPARLALARVHLRMGRFADSEKEFRRALEHGSPEGEVWPSLLRTLIHQGKYPEALESIAGLPRELADTSEIRAIHADALLAQGRRDAARELLGSAESISDSRPLARLAQLAAVEGEIDQARRLADRAANAQPPSVQAQLIKGGLAARAGELDTARQAYARAVEIDPFSVEAGFGLAQTLLAQNKVDEAESVVESFTGRLGDRLPFAGLRSLIALERRDFETAKTEAERILAAASGFRPALYVAGVANTALGNDETAISQLRRFVAGGSAPPAAYKALAWAHMRLERPEEALAALERADLPASDLPGLRLAVQAALQSGDPERAKSLLRGAVEESPEGASLSASLAALEIATGQTEEARRLLESLPEDAAGDSLPDKARLALLHIRAGNAERALELAGEITEADETAPAGAIIAGLARVSLDATDAAIADFERALEIAPGNRVAALALATLYNRTDRPDEAETVLRSALEAGRGDGSLLSGLVQLLVAQNKAGDAEALLRRMVDDRPEDPASHALLARLLLASNRAEEALPIAEQASELAPEAPPALETLGRVQLALGRSGDAVATFERLAELRPQSADAQFLLARAQAGAGRTEGATSTLQGLLARAPERHDARIVLARLLLLQDRENAAERHIQQLTDALPEVVDVIELEAALARARGETEDAIAHYRRAFERQPNASRAMTLARLQWEAEQRQAAIETLDTALATEAIPNAAGLRIQLAEYHYRNGDLEVAIDAYRSLVESGGGDNAVLRNQLAWVLWESGETQAALPHAERALELAPDQPEIKDTLGVILLETGETERAVSLLGEAAEARPESHDIRFHYARALVETGQVDEARDLLRELASIEAFSGRDEAATLLAEIGG